MMGFLPDFVVTAVYISALIGIAIIARIVHQLTCCADHFTTFERLALGMIGGGMLMVSGSVLAPLVVSDVSSEISPYNVWPRILVWAGVLIYLSCDFSHRRMERSRLAGKLKPLVPFGGLAK